MCLVFWAFICSTSQIFINQDLETRLAKGFFWDFLMLYFPQSTCHSYVFGIFLIRKRNFLWERWSILLILDFHRWLWRWGNLGVSDKLTSGAGEFLVIG